MDRQHTRLARAHIEADLEHLDYVMGRIEDTVCLTAEDMRLRRALRWAMARKRRILERLPAGLAHCAA